MATLPRPADPYRVLGVRVDADLGEIKDAHRRLAKRFHPDAAGGDRQRFLAVQEAYQVLVDPLRRKEWDLRHPLGPVRAGTPGPKGASRSGTRAGGSTPGPQEGKARPQRAHPPDGEPRRAPGGPWSQSGRDPRADSYTWSARGVPWWETDPPPGAGKRQPGRRRPRAGASDEAPADFEVFNRSSGAAWSSAARAHFRRSTSDMASGAAEPYATRWTTPDDGTTRIRQDPSDRSGTRGGSARPTARPAFDASGAARRPRGATFDKTGSTAWAAGASGPGATASGTRPSSGATFGATVGSTFGSARSTSASSARPLTSAARPTVFRPPTPWPTLPERLICAGLGWIPLALLVAFGGGAMTGCDAASVGCPAVVPTLQAGALVALAAGLLAFPRVAYVATGAGVGMVVAGLVALFLSAASGALTFGDGAPAATRMPSALTAALVVVVMLAAYAVAGLAVWRDRPLRRPWLDRPARPAARPVAGPGSWR